MPCPCREAERLHASAILDHADSTSFGSIVRRLFVDPQRLSSHEQEERCGSDGITDRPEQQMEALRSCYRACDRSTVMFGRLVIVEASDQSFVAIVST